MCRLGSRNTRSAAGGAAALRTGGSSIFPFAMEKLYNSPKEELGVVEPPQSIFQPPETLVTRENIPNAPEHAFLLHGILSSKECADWIQATERTGFASLEKSFPAGYRSNDRILNLNQKVAEALFSRIIPYLTAEDCRSTPVGPTGDGVWIPHTLNEGLKFCRYRSGCKFQAHMDGPWTPSVDLHSIYTVIFYLNQNFTGGATNFLEYDAAAEDQLLKNVSELERAAIPRKVLCRVAPRTGSALIFKHQIMHEGAEITDGRKYILRTEIIFRRLRSVLEVTPLANLSSNAEMKKITQLYLNSEKLAKEGESKKTEFVNEYLHALRIQNRIVPPKQYGRLPKDVLLIIFEHVRIVDLLRAMQCSRQFHRLARDPELWRLRYAKQFPKEWKAKPNQTLSIDWFSEYRAQYFGSVLRHENPKAILQLGRESVVCGISLPDQTIRTIVPIFKCPYCEFMLSEYALFTHCQTAHKTQSPNVVCPICAARPGGDKNYVSSHFFTHLRLKHSTSSATYARCTSSREAYLSVASLFEITVPGHGHSGGYTEMLPCLQNVHLPYNSPSPFITPTVERLIQSGRYTYDTEIFTHCEKVLLFPNKEYVLGDCDPNALRACILGITKAIPIHICPKVVYICPDMGFSPNVIDQLRYLGNGWPSTQNPITVPFSVATLRVHGLSSGVVVCIESPTFAFLTLVVDSQCVRYLPIDSASVISDAVQLAHLVSEFVHNDEHETAGFSVVLTGDHVDAERRKFDAQSEMYRAFLKENPNASIYPPAVEMKPISEKEKEKKAKEEKKKKEKEEKAKEKLKKKNKQPISIVSGEENAELVNPPPPIPQSMPDPRLQLPNRLLSALHQIHPAYRVLCTLDPIWDAVEGAARAMCISENRPQCTLVKLETLLPKKK